MKKILLLLLAVSVLMTHACCVVAAEAYPEDSSWMDMDTNKGLFYDVTVDMWFADYAYEAFERGIVRGVSPSIYVRLFQPDDIMTREQALAILNRMDKGFASEYIGAKYNTGFADVPEDAWYAVYVDWGVKFGITEGVGGELFGTGRAITREELATFMLRYLELKEFVLKEGEDVTPNFEDAADVSEWAVDAVEYLRAHGILTGDDNGKVRPTDEITRAEAVAMLVRFDESLLGDVSKMFDFDSFDREDVYELRLGADVDGPDYITHSITDSAEIDRFIEGLDGVEIISSATKGSVNGIGGYSIGLYNADGERLWGYGFHDNYILSGSRYYYLDKAYFTEYAAILTELFNDYYNK